LIFRKHHGESFPDAWTRFKYLLQKVLRYGLDLLPLLQLFHTRIDYETQMRLDYVTDGEFWEYDVKNAWENFEIHAQYRSGTWDPKNVSVDLFSIWKAQSKSLFRDKKIRVETPRCMSWLGTTLIQDEHIGDLDKMEDRVENLSPPSTSQVLPSFEAYTPPVTYPEEVEETLGTPIEVEHLNQTQLEDICLNTYNDNLTLSSREVPSFDEPEPQPKPLPNLPSLDVNLGIKIGSDQPIKPYSPGSLRTKVVDSKPCREEVNIGVENDLTCLHHPFMIDHKKHYGFKPGLLGQDGSPTCNLLKLIENDPFLGENLNSPINPIELGKVMMIGAHPFEHIIHPPLFPHEAYFHPKGVYHYFHPHLILSVGKTSSISVK
jgi:hypothetical protein